MPDPTHDLWNVTFLKTKAVQFWADFLLWEHLLNAHEELHTVIELGSLRGGFSLYFLLQAKARGLDFHTFDLTPPEVLAHPVAQALHLAEHFHAGDLFAYTGSRSLLEAILHDPANHPLMLFCDDGNKPKEFQTFVPYLQADDLVAVHDWGTEFTAADAEPVASLVEEILVPECQAFNSFTRFYRRVAR